MGSAERDAEQGPSRGHRDAPTPRAWVFARGTPTRSSTRVRTKQEAPAEGPRPRWPPWRPLSKMAPSTEGPPLTRAGPVPFPGTERKGLVRQKDGSISRRSCPERPGLQHHSSESAGTRPVSDPAAPRPSAPFGSRQDGATGSGQLRGRAGGRVEATLPPFTYMAAGWERACAAVHGAAQVRRRRRCRSEPAAEARSAGLGTQAVSEGIRRLPKKDRVLGCAALQRDEGVSEAEVGLGWERRPGRMQNGWERWLCRQAI